MKNLKFQTQLLIGFFIIILLSLLSSITSIYELQQIKSETELIIKHHFTVSNAVKDININITAIHRTMKDLALAKNELEIQKAIILVNHHDSIIHKTFIVVINRYLGEKQVVMDVYKSYNQWEIIRNEVISLKREGLNNEAIEVTRGKGAAHVKLLIQKTDILIAFALNKADEFYLNVENHISTTIKYITGLILILLIISVSSSVFITRNVLKPIHHFISQLGEIYLSKQVTSPTMLIMNEKSLLDYTITEIKSAHNQIFEQNKKLNSFNDELEMQVKDKTHKLQTQNELLKNQNEKIEISEAKLKEAQEIAILGNWEFNIIENELMWSDEVFRIYEVNPHDYTVTYDSSQEFIHPEDLKNVTDSFAKSLKDRTPYEVTHRLVLKSGKIKYVKEKCKTDYDKFGNPLYASGVVIDVTKEKIIEHALLESEAKLKDSNKTKDKFLSIISHDLKSPFNSILGLTNILVEEHKNYDDQQRDVLIRSINNTASRAYNLLENLLTWSSSQSGKIQYIPEELNLNTVLNENIFDLQAQAENKDIKVINKISNLEFVYADKNMLAVVLRNLISNAIKFTPKNGEITLSSVRQKKSNCLTISVADTGVGIAEETLKDLFNSDKKTSTSGTEKESGTGLGLILCKEFVEKHQGKIWAESTPNKGSVFIFTIPAHLKTNNS